jgi:hypothetical protein
LSRGMPRTSMTRTVWSPSSEVAFYLAVPAGQAAGIGECRPQVLDIGAEAVFDAYGARTVCRSQAAQDARAGRFIAGHLVPLRSRFPRPPPGVRAREAWSRLVTIVHVLPGR